MIEVTNIRKSFEGVEVLKGIDASFEKGKTNLIIGQSGSGKTFSMLGPEEVIQLIKSGGEISEEVQNMYGIIPRAIRDFFEFMNKSS